MKKCHRMKQVIGNIAKQHDFDLMAADGSSLKLDNDPYMTLSICAYRKGIIAVNHQRQDYYGDIEYDPEVQFWVVDTNPNGIGDGWFPITFEQPPMQVLGKVIGGFQEYVKWEEGRITGVMTSLQRDLASFCHQWANNIHHQGFDEPDRVTVKLYK